MANTTKPLLKLKNSELVPLEEDRRVEIGVYDALLPCRKYEVSYKVAVPRQGEPELGVSPAAR